jgi:hypothetical protein
MGGVFNMVNFALYHYGANNPIKYTDPDGRADFTYEYSEDCVATQSGKTIDYTDGGKIDGSKDITIQIDNGKGCAQFKAPDGSTITISRSGTYNLNALFSNYIKIMNERKNDWGFVFTIGPQGSFVASGGFSAGGGIVIAFGAKGISIGGYGTFAPAVGSPNISVGASAQFIPGTSNPYVITGNSFGIGGSGGVSGGASVSVGGDATFYPDSGYVGFGPSASLGLDMPGITGEGHVNPVIFTGYAPLIGVRK